MPPHPAEAHDAMQRRFSGLRPAKTGDRQMADKVNNLQDIFLNTVRKAKTPVTMFLVKGVKLQGIITWFDNFSVLLRRDGQSQLIYKHAISTVMPSNPMDLMPVAAAFANPAAPRTRQLQDVFLSAARQQENPVT